MTTIMTDSKRTNGMMISGKYDDGNKDTAADNDENDDLREAV